MKDIQKKIIEIIDDIAYYPSSKSTRESKANEIILLWNEMIVAKLKEVKHREVTFDDIASLFISL
ncbi:MAG TPA: hypothetical protein VMV77_09035 [Bacteroidales bacterium]|nr:hypothetical protein [Bacteroidales bacterium]